MEWMDLWVGGGVQRQPWKGRLGNLRKFIHFERGSFPLSNSAKQFFHKCSQTQLYVSSMWQPVPGGECRTWRALRRSRAGEGETVGAESTELKHSSYSAVERASAINGERGVWKISAYCIERNNNVILRKQVLVRETREMRLIFTVDKVG